MKFLLARILGNELPPRDTPGSKVRVLRFILEHERSNCPNLWVLNRITDEAYRNELIEILNEFGQHYKILDLDWKAYRKLKNFDDKVQFAININNARNKSLEFALESDAEFIFVFDGDCFFSADAWKETIESINTGGRQYYGVPGIRISNTIPADLTGYKRWEPSLVFHRDAELRFNETLRFGRKDKIELLERLGYRCARSEAILMPEAPCQNVGFLLHMSFDGEHIEENVQTRMKAREDSLITYISKLDKAAAII